MARKFIAPGTFRRELDVSDNITPAGTSVGAMVGKTHNGIHSSRVLVTNTTDFYETFGRPLSGLSSENAYYGAAQFLQESSYLWFVRSVFGDEQYANLGIPASPAKTVANLTLGTLSYSSSATSGDVGILAAAAILSAGAITNSLATLNDVSAATIVATDTSSLLVIDGFDDGNKPNSIYELENASLGSTIRTETYTSGVQTITYTVTGDYVESAIIGSIGPGTYGNDIGIAIITCASEQAQGIFDWGYLFDDPESTGVFSSASDAIWKQVYKIKVFKKATGANESVFVTAGGISATALETFLVSNNPNLQRADGSILYAPDVVNGISQYIYIKPVNFSYPQPMTVVKALQNGGNSYATTPGDVVAGWDLFSSRERVTFNIAIPPQEATDANVPIFNKVATVLSSRLDSIGVAQVAASTVTNTTQIVSKWNGGTYSFPAPSYMAVYAGYDQIFDQFTDKKVYIPKSIFGASIMARTDNVAQTWDAPAGVNRGIIPSIGQNRIFTEAQIGYLYDNNINTSKFINGFGNVLWGQKTAQRKSSALDRINVRRLLLLLENSIEPLLLGFLFEPNTASTRGRVFSIIDSYMQDIQSAQGVTKYQVVVDETNNPASVIDNNQLNVYLYVQPSRTIEFIQLTVIVQRTGVNFTEL